MYHRGDFNFLTGGLTIFFGGVYFVFFGGGYFGYVVYDREGGLILL